MPPQRTLEDRLNVLPALILEKLKEVQPLPSLAALMVVVAAFVRTLSITAFAFSVMAAFLFLYATLLWLVGQTRPRPIVSLSVSFIICVFGALGFVGVAMFSMVSTVPEGRGYLAAVLYSTTFLGQLVLMWVLWRSFGDWRTANPELRARLDLVMVLVFAGFSTALLLPFRESIGLSIVPELTFWVAGPAAFVGLFYLFILTREPKAPDEVQ